MHTTSHSNPNLGLGGTLRQQLGRVVRREATAGEAARAVAARCARTYARVTQKHAKAHHNAAIEHASAAIALYNERRYAEAEQQFRDAVRCDPGYGRALYGLGNSLAKQGKQAAARQAWMQAAEADPYGPFAEKSRRKLQRM
jgi:Flp pilus assembly protein TadD